MPAHAQHANDTKTARLLLVALLVIIALGAALRFYRLGGKSLWLDEAYSVKFSKEAPAGIIDETANDVHPPLYYFALHYLMLTLGDSEASVRLLSALFGILALFVIYKVASQMFNRATGLLAAGGLALSRFHLDFSQEARMYSLLCLLTLLSIYYFLKLLEGKSRYALAGYIITTALMMYTHAYSFFIISAQNIYLLTLFFASRDTFKRLWKRWIVSQVILAVLFVPWLSVQLQQLHRVQRGFWIQPPPPNSLLTTLVMHAGSNPLAWIFALLIALAIFAGWRGLQEESPAQSSDEDKKSLPGGRLKLYLLLLWLLCPIMLPYIISEILTPIFLPKYTIAALPAFIILAARGLLSFRFHQLRMILVLLLICFSLATLRDYFRSPGKETWREAVAFINGLTKPNDLVLFHKDPGRVPFDYYYKRGDLIEKPFPNDNSKTDANNLPKDLKAAVESHDRVWLVVSHSDDPEKSLISKYLASWYKTAQHIEFSGVEMYLFERTK